MSPSLLHTHAPVRSAYSFCATCGDEPGVGGAVSVDSRLISYLLNVVCALLPKPPNRLRGSGSGERGAQK